MRKSIDMLRCAAFATALCLANLPTCSIAQVVLDQSVVPNPATAFQGITSPSMPFKTDTAQTFTVGVSGSLSRVDVFIALDALSPFYTGSAVLDWDIRPISVSHQPVDDDSAALAGGSLTLNSSAYSFVTLDLSQNPLPVFAGEGLAIVLSSSSSPMSWGGSEIAGYAGGESWQRSETFNNGLAWVDTQPQTDLGFQTFVTVPEPSGLFLVGLGAVPLAGFTIRKRIHRPPQ